MTKEQVEKELSEISAKEAQSWNSYRTILQKQQDAIQKARSDYNASFSLFKSELDKLENEWYALKQRQDKLKAFLELA